MPRIWLPWLILLVVSVGIAALFWISNEVGLTIQGEVEEAGSVSVQEEVVEENSSISLERLPMEYTHSHGRVNDEEDQGTVLVRVFDQEGNPIQQNYAIQLEVHRPATPPETEGAWLHHTSYLDNGKAIFPSIPYGRQLRLKATSRDGRVSTYESQDGPTKEAPQLTWTLRPLDHRVILSGRLLNQRGKIGANRAFRTLVYLREEHGDTMETGQLRTDANGRFKFVLDKQAEHVSSLRLAIELSQTSKHPKRSALTDRMPIEEPGVLDLGDLVLKPLPILASGIAVDQNGRPVSGTRLRLGNDTLAWRDDIAETDEEGRFEFRGHPMDYEWNLDSASMDYLLKEEEIPAGQDLVIRLHATVDVSVRILHGERILLGDDDMTSRKLSVSLLPEDPAVKRSHLLGSAWATSWRGHCIPGSYRVHIKSIPLMEDLFLGDPFFVGYDEEKCQIPDIQLGGQLSFFQLTVLNPDRSPASSYFIGASPQTLILQRESTMNLVRRSDATSLVVGQQTTDMQTVSNSTKDQVIVLKR